MLSPLASIAEAREKLLRQVAWQILFIAVCQFGLAQFHRQMVGWSVSSLLLALTTIPAFASSGSVRKRAATFILPLAIISLAAPWKLGGLAHPICLLPVAAIHTTAFLLGVPLALLLAFASLANIVALTIGLKTGLLVGAPATPETTVLYIAVLTGHVLLFISTPLNVLRHLLTQAATDLAARRDNEEALHRLTDELESNVAQRTEELVRSREKLHGSVAEVSESMKGSIADLLQASRDLAESLPADATDARWEAYRISSGCERMETMHTALLRFCMLGEAALDLRPLSPEAHTGMVHRIWNEIRDLHPDKTISFILDPIPGCVCDADLIRQVWQNLLANAANSAGEARTPFVKAYFRGGDFCVEASGPSFSTVGLQGFSSLLEENGAEKAPGQDEVGLAMSRRILEMHGTAIRLENGSNGGSVFKFDLPAIPA